MRVMIVIIAVLAILLAGAVTYSSIITARFVVIKREQNIIIDTNERITDEIEKIEKINAEQQRILDGLKEAKTLRDYIRISEELNKWSREIE